MRKTLVLFGALILTGVGTAYGQKWRTIHIHGEPLAIQLMPGMPVVGQFRTEVVRNLPPSDIVGAPQSLEIQVLGNCQTRTFQIWGVLPYSGKMRAGYPEAELATGPEPVVRRIQPNSPMEQVFKVVCKP